MYDVIIVGGGPTGSHATRRLAEGGYKVLVLEKNPGTEGKACCTGIVGKECIESFGIVKEVILRELNSATLFSPSRNTLRLHRKETQAVVLDRKAFDKYLAEKAQNAGAEYRFNCHVKGIGAIDDGVRIQLSSKGKNYKEHTKAAVIACGFNPEMNERAGMGAYKDHVTGAQAEVETTGLDEVEVYLGDIAPGFFGWLVPTAKGMAKAGLLSRTEPGARLKKWLNQLTEQGKIASRDVKISYGGIPLKPPRRTYGERIIAIGDAAGHVKPTSGGGIYYGLLGAEIASKVLYEALTDNDLSEKRLANYERAWRKKLGRELRTGYWARKLFEKLSNKQIDRIFEIIKTSGIDEAILKAEDLSFDWHSKTIIQLLKYQMLLKTLNIIKLPFKSNSIDR